MSSSDKVECPVCGSLQYERSIDWINGCCPNCVDREDEDD